jgi:hypothetical protein
MSVTLEEARDEVLGRVEATLYNIDALIRPTLLFEGVHAQPSGSEEGSWAWASFKVLAGAQESMGGVGGTSLWRTTGSLVIEVYTSALRGLLSSDRICQAFRDGFRGYTSPGGVWFRNHRIENVGISGSFYRSDVVIDFEYSERR